jgi:hypothetical protein
MENEKCDHNKYQTIDQEMSKRLTYSFDQVDDENSGRLSHAMQNDRYNSNCETSTENHSLNGDSLPQNGEIGWIQDGLQDPSEVGSWLLRKR